MSIQLLTSNHIENLCKKLSKDIQTKEDPFEISHIVTQTDGMDKWLSTEISAHNGVFSNFEFTTPESFITKLYSLAGLFSNRLFSVEQMKWEFYLLLEDESFKKKFTFIADYYAEDDLKRLQLASETAALMDQYMVYRANYIRNWNKNKKAELKEIKHKDEFVKHEAWQKWLFLELKKKSKYSLDNVQLKDKLLAEMDMLDFKAIIKTNFPKVYIFEASTISQFRLEIFQKLSQITSLHLYLLDPSPQTEWYLQDPNTGNDMLTSCQHQGRYTFNLLHSKSEFKQAIDSSMRKEPETNSLLSHLQKDIYHNTNTTVNQNLKDNSLQVASSYTPVREVEALYQYLIKAFDEDKFLKPHDISIQLSQVDTYAPLIKAVFDNGAIKIPYQICDISYSNSASLTNAIEQLFLLSVSSYKAESVLQLLEHKCVSDRFDIDDMDDIRQLVRMGNIRYGLKGKKEDDTYLFSWTHGINRLILGYSMQLDESIMFDKQEHYPTQVAEGNLSHNIFRLKAFVDTLKELDKLTKEEKTLLEWKEYLLNVVVPKLFYVQEESDVEELQIIQQKLVNINYIAESVCDKVPFSIFKYSILSSLKEESKNKNYINGQVSFSAMLPMRALPYKIIAVLGLNADTFPRRPSTTGFNLISIDEHEGDRNVKYNDKYLFLETILSAREKLYLSYIGSSIKDNSRIPPSLLVEELLDYLKKATSTSYVNHQVCFNHPLHNFSQKYFTDDKYYIYSTHNDENTLGRNEGELEKIQEVETKTIELDDILRFLNDPFKWYYNNKLSIYYTEEDIVLPEDEVFELDALSQWQMKFDLLTLAEEQTQSYLNKQKSQGNVPLKNMAKIEILEQGKSIESLKIRYQEATQHYKNETLDLDITLDAYTITSRIPNIFNDKQVCTNVSKKGSQAKHQMSAWLKHLMLMATGKNIDTLIINNDDLLRLEANLLTPIEAIYKLNTILSFYLKNKSDIVPFTPKVAYKLISNQRKKPNTEVNLTKAFKELKDEAVTSKFKSFYNPYIRKEMEQGYFEHITPKQKDDMMNLSECLFDVLHSKNTLEHA